MISVSEALKRLLTITSPLETEWIDLSEAAGRVLAQDTLSPRDQPPFDSSSMDGFAVSQNDSEAGKQLKIIGTVPAGADIPDYCLGRNEAVRIYTGAPIPKGADRVVIVEDVNDCGSIIILNEHLEENLFIRLAGSDFKKGYKVSAPHVLTPALISLLAAMNQARLLVYKKPIVSIIPTGDELVMPGQIPADNQIVASNVYGLKSILEVAGCEVKLLPIARDNESSISNILNMAQSSDLILTIGGASVGDFDLVQDTAHKMGFEISFYKIAMRPGKPLFAGRNPRSLLVGLPGNPVSAIVCGYVFILPVIQAMQRLNPTGLPRKIAQLSAPLNANGPREHYLRSIVDYSTERPNIKAHEHQDSSLLNVLYKSNALMIREPNDRPRKAGEKVKFISLNQSYLQ